MTGGGTVGIIANPASGKDIRRLVAHGSTFDNNEKINIVRRVLLGLDAVGVSRVWFMPDTYAIVTRAAAGVELRLATGTAADGDARTTPATRTRRRAGWRTSGGSDRHAWRRRDQSGGGEGQRRCAAGRRSRPARTTSSREWSRGRWRGWRPVSSRRGPFRCGARLSGGSPGWTCSSTANHGTWR